MIKASTMKAPLPMPLVTLRQAAVHFGALRALQAVGEFVGVERSIIVLFSADGLAIDRIYEWCAVGIEPLAEKLAGLSVERFHGSVEPLERPGPIQARCVPLEASAEKESWKEMGITSPVRVSLISEHALIGFLCLDAERAEKR